MQKPQRQTFSPYPLEVKEAISNPTGLVLQETFGSGPLSIKRIPNESVGVPCATPLSRCIHREWVTVKIPEVSSCHGRCQSQNINSFLVIYSDAC